jgi:hypothetical protein
MKKTLLLIPFLFGVSYSAMAMPVPMCTPENLSDYEGLGSTGCTIGDLTFSNFSYTPTEIGGAITPPATTVMVDPISGVESGLTFAAGWAAGQSQLEDSLINFKVSCTGCEIDDWVLQIGGEGESGDGLVNVAETSPEVGTGLVQSSVANVTTGVGSGTFMPVTSLSVTKDILVFGGGVTDTSSALSSVTNLFSTIATPEPSLVILCAGLMGLVPIARRKFVR